MNSRFVLSNVIEDQISDTNGYDILEPTLKLEIDGRGVFGEAGLDGVDRVVVMHFLETAIKETRRLIEEVPRNRYGEYTFWLTGTGVGIKLKRDGTVVDLLLEINPHLGPVQSRKEIGTRELGRISVIDWVEAIVALSKELSDRFRTSNPTGYTLVETQDKKREILEKWLKSTK